MKGLGFLVAVLEVSRFTWEANQRPYIALPLRQPVWMHWT